MKINKNEKEEEILIICEGNQKSPDKKIIAYMLRHNNIKFDKESIIPIGGKCDFIEKIRNVGCCKNNLLSVVWECSKNNKRNFNLNKQFKQIFMFFDLNSNNYEINFSEEEIKALDVEIFYARPYLEVDLGFKSKEDFDLSEAKKKLKKRKHLLEWYKCIDKINS